MKRILKGEEDGNYLSMFIIFEISTGRILICVFNYPITEFDECVLIDHGCEHNCINTLGGFECSCKPGYELHSDGKHCEGEL